MQSDEWLNAARAGDDKRVAELLEPNLIETKDQMGNTALHHAASVGHETVVARLLAARPGLLHARNNSGLTSFDMAATNGHDKVVAQMLTNVVGLDISFSLLKAARGGHDKVVDLLLTASSKFTRSESLAVLSLHCLAEKGNQKAFTQLLAIYPSLIHGNVFGTALHNAASQGHDNLVSQILALCPDAIHAVGRFDGCNVLMSAVKGGHSFTPEKLLAIRPELIFHVSESDGNAVLHYAVVGCGDLEFVAKLWRLNPQALTQANLHGQTPFHMAVGNKKDELVELFQWSLSFDDIVSAFTFYEIDYQERYRPVMAV